MPGSSWLWKFAHLSPCPDPPPDWNQWSVGPDIMFWETLFHKKTQVAAVSEMAQRVQVPAARRHLSSVLGTLREEEENQLLQVVL